MSVQPDVVEALTCYRTIRIEMPESDGLKEGREMINRIQEQCPFPLAYVQRLGTDPVVFVWRYRSMEHAMEGHEVADYAC